MTMKGTQKQRQSKGSCLYVIFDLNLVNGIKMQKMLILETDFEGQTGFKELLRGTARGYGKILYI